MTRASAPSDDLLNAYGRALDEVYRLRTLLCIQSLTTEAHLTYATFPKSRRKYAEAQVRDMQEAALGGSAVVLARHREDAAGRERQSRSLVGMPHTLTRSAWEQTVAKGEVQS